MPAKMRLSRHGKKGAAFYHIVVADGRAPRDGKFIEKIGTYNPISNPAIIDLNVDKALTWLQNGAQPTPTVRAILSYTGVLYKNHLHKGILKGALTEAQAETKFEAWKKEKDAKIAAKSSELSEQARNEQKAAMEAEVKVNEARAAELAKAKAAIVEAQVKAAQAAQAAKSEAEAAKATPEEVAPEATTEETPAAE